MEAYERLERDWAVLNQLDPAGMVACSSGTAALHLALEAMQLPLGGKVITSDFNMIAVPRAITLAGLVPVFVDCDEWLTLNPRQIPIDGDCWEAIIAVHIYGRRCDMTEISERAQGGLVIEDLAEAHGVMPHERTDAACWSFYKNKIIAGEEGGAVWFSDPTHAKLARSLRSLGFTDAHNFDHVPRGHNYRMSNSHAELVLKSLSLAVQNVAKRRWNAKTLDSHCPAEWRMPPRDTPWVYDIRIPGMSAAQQDNVVKALQTAGIAARHAFKPMSWQKEYRGCENALPTNAAVASREVIYLPIGPEQVVLPHYAFDTIRKSLVT